MYRHRVTTAAVWNYMVILLNRFGQEVEATVLQRK